MQCTKIMLIWQILLLQQAKHCCRVLARKVCFYKLKLSRFCLCKYWMPANHFDSKLSKQDSDHLIKTWFLKQCFIHSIIIILLSIIQLYFLALSSSFIFLNSWNDNFEFEFDFCVLGSGVVTVPPMKWE